MVDMSEPPTQREIVAWVSDGAVLAPESDGVRRLPSIEDSGGWPSVAKLREAVGSPDLVLLGPPLRQPDEVVTLHVVTEATRHDAPGRRDDWVPLERLAELADGTAVAEQVRRTVAQASGAEPRPAHRPDWFRVGWRDEVETWVDESLSSLGLRRSGPSTVLQMWSLATVLRTPVVDAAGLPSRVVFKASPQWFATEPSITSLVGGFAQRCTPVVLAVDQDRAWMLMEEMQGVDGDPDPVARRSRAVATAPVTARLHLASLDHLDALRAAGIPDRSLEPTLSALSDVLADGLELELLTEAERSVVRAREPWLREQLDRLYACGIPTTLIHGDLHLDNVADDKHGPVLYDWSDACLAHPFIDAVHLARRVSEEDRPAVYEAYSEPWQEAFPDADVDGAFRLALVADRIFDAISYEGIQRHQEEASVWEMAGAGAGALRALLESTELAV
jgi:aminoglycoside phosphotransferase (APT) family kinase protein